MKGPATNLYITNSDISLVNCIIVLRKYSRMILSVTAAITLLTFIIVLVLPNKYIATAQLLPPQQNYTLSAQLLDTLGGGAIIPGSAGGAGPQSLGASLLGLKSFSDLYLAMLKSQTIYDAIIKRFNLKKVYGEKYIEDARKALSKHVKITTQVKSGIIDIEVTDKSRKRAAEIANAFVEELEKVLHVMARKEASSRLAFLEQEQSKANLNLAKSEDALRDFSEQSKVVQIDAQTRGMIEYLARLRALIDAKEVQIRVLRQGATSNNYDVIRLETELKGLRENLQNVEKQWDRSKLGDVRLTATKLPSLGMEYFRLYREVKFQEGLNKLYSSLVNLARLDQVRNYTVLQLLDPAIPPERSSNKLLLPTLTVGVITFFIMIFVSFLREYWLTVISPEDKAETG